MSDSMMSEKYFLIYSDGRNRQSIAAHKMGMILRRGEVNEIVGEFGSEAKAIPGDDSINIVPPIADDRLPELGEALVKLATRLDPTKPHPTYQIY